MASVWNLSDPNSETWNWIRETYGQVPRVEQNGFLYAGDGPREWLSPLNHYQFGDFRYGGGGNELLTDPKYRSQMATLAEAIYSTYLQDPTFDVSGALRSANLTPEQTQELQFYINGISTRIQDKPEQNKTLLSKIATNPLTYILPVVGAVAGAAGAASGASASGGGTAAASGAGEAVAGGAMDMGVGLGETFNSGFGTESVLSGAGSTGSTGGGMWDWLDGLSDSGPFTTNPSLADLGGDTSFFSDNLDFLSGLGDSQGPFTTNPSLADLGGDTSAWSPGLFDGLGSRLLRSLLGNQNASGGSTRSGGGSILDAVANRPLEAAFNSTPFLLALMEANRQGGDIRQVTDRLSGLADQAGTIPIKDAVLGPYNRETSAGLDTLRTSLANRGVLGSSFGNMDVTNFKTARDTGAGELATKAMLGSIGTQGALLDSVLKGRTQANTNRNLLLGAGLGASGKLFEPQRDPFNLRALMGL